MYIDLQTHTLASDGILTPDQLVRKAKKLGFSHLAKTDHDNVDLTQEFLAAGKKYGLEAISGIEISSFHAGKSVHILGLGVDYKNKALNDYAKSCLAARKKRGFKMAAELERQGWHIKKSELDKKLVARPHVANAVLNHSKNKSRLVREFGRLPDFHTFIRKYLVIGHHAFVPKTFAISANDAIRLIKRARGLSIIAHPGSQSPEISYTKKEFEKIARLGFDGLEVYSSIHSAEQIKYFASQAIKFNLLASAGSDYHGYDHIRPLGICHNGHYVTQKTCASLLAHLKHRF